MDLPLYLAQAPPFFPAVKILLDAANGVSDKHKSIVALFTEMQEATARFDQYLGIDLKKMLKDVVADFLVAMLQIMGLTTKAINQGRVVKYLKNVGRGKDTALTGAIENLELSPSVKQAWLGLLR